MSDEEVAARLEAGGYPEHVVQGGKRGLLSRWQRFVEEVERGYRFGLEEYRNDLDLRSIIAVVGIDEEVLNEDQRLLSMLHHREVRIWDSEAKHPFWVYGYPKNAHGELLEDLKSEKYARS